MADDRMVRYGVFMNGEVLTDADKIEEACTQAQIKYLKVRGAISGGFKGKAGKGDPLPAAEPEPARKPPTGPKPWEGEGEAPAEEDAEK